MGWAHLPGPCPEAGSAAAAPAFQHLSSSQRDVDALPSSMAGSDFTAPCSSDDVFLDDILPQTHLQTLPACIRPEDRPPNQMTSHG